MLFYKTPNAKPQKQKVLKLYIYKFDPQKDGFQFEGFIFYLYWAFKKNILRKDLYRKYNSKHCFGGNSRDCLLKGEVRDLHMQMHGI